MKAEIEKLVSGVLCDAGDINVVIGPVRFRPDRIDTNEWYFNVASCDKHKHFSHDMALSLDGRDAMEKLRALVIAAFTERRPIVIHDMDDELCMARFCEALWPGERISKIRAEMEAEDAELIKKAGSA